MAEQQLRLYQIFAIQALREAVKRGILSMILCAPTGAGKTTIAAALVRASVQKGNRVFFIVDSIELIDQTVARFEADGLTVGVIQADHHKTNGMAPVQVCTIQTLRTRWTGLSAYPSLIIIDEAHVLHKAHQTIIEWAKERNIVVLGLSATPYRYGLGRHFSELIQTTTTAELIEQGYLSDFVVYAPLVPSMKGVKVQNGDYAVAELDKMMGDAKVVGDIVKHWFQLALNRQTLVFCPSVANSRQIADAFTEAGIKAAHLDAKTPKLEREKLIKAYRAGDITVLCNVAILTKGFDAPETGCVVLARPTKSLSLHIQICGRGLRTAESKDNCVFIDCAGNMIRNGFPTDPLPTHLDCGDDPERRGTRKERALVPCDFCNFLSNKVVCPRCGEARIVKAFGERKEPIEAVDGELVYLPTAQKPDEPKYSDRRIRQLQSMALWHAQLRGYARGWEKHFMREVCGRCVDERMAPAQPDQQALNLFKHWRIKKAKEKQKRNVA